MTTRIFAAADRSLCERPSGKWPYIIHVLPLHRAATAETSSDATALVLIADPEEEPEPAPALLRRLYGLTNTEASVVMRIVRGAGLKEISEESSVSLTTVRTHLQHVFDKTGTHRQAELVGFVLAHQQLTMPHLEPDTSTYRWSSPTHHC